MFKMLICIFRYSFVYLRVNENKQITNRLYGPYCYRYKVTPAYKYYYYLYLLNLPLCWIVNVGWALFTGWKLRSSCIQLSLKPPLFSIEHCPSILFYVEIFSRDKARYVSYASRLNILIKNSTNFADRTLERCNLSTSLTCEEMQAADGHTCYCCCRSFL